MENEKTKINEEKREYLSAIFLLQGLFIGVLLIAVYIIKIFFPSLYTPIKEWTSDKFYQNTSIEQIFDNGEYSNFSENEYSVY